ncbi:lipopolysaccharide kinase [Corynebacterium phocae]|uniref:Lipopolysaccharide kinase n=1 Tax=Corynebacterium phocae TaxID=161895 RepID=A0A1L7D6W3_9CORY|nr:DUF4032 domain-containing protein [Corynebacterium phocae]APT93791.1 lipopolysaccharide kinase [Corynebacterium phocae]KAA8721593.1 DUF4032 domain-containing protein [Corynebacterium phocae]
MTNSMNIDGSAYAPSLLPLPWSTPLDKWGDDVVVRLPRGISRHVVRFVHLGDATGTDFATMSPTGGIIAAIKEIGRKTAHHEYAMLRELRRVKAPAVTPIAVITGRRSPEWEVLTAALVTEHLRFSLPYREIFSQKLEPAMADKLIRALAILLVRLHLLNFYWGDVSLSNTLFRRDADTFSAYLVDAETGEFQPELSRNRRLYDVEIARVNVIGELMDLSSGGTLDPEIDPIALGNSIETYYVDLWAQLTEEFEVPAAEYWRVKERVEKLAEMGFDIGELRLSSGASGMITAKPKIVDAGHHRNLIVSLLGMDVEEQQARRFLSEIRHYQADLPIQQAARAWYNEEYLPTVQAIPPELIDKLEPPQIFHEILDHRYFLSQENARAVPIEEAATSYYHKVLPSHRDEKVLIVHPNSEESDLDGGLADDLDFLDN